ncbi:MAG: hypothetical protein MZW92_57735 [Comamonadaceae bacterium]|nr:hypothetical protein [Comamonadaceae bacterium]
MSDVLVACNARRPDRGDECRRCASWSAAPTTRCAARRWPRCWPTRPSAARAST